jgi:hypothetical protein
MTRTTLLVVVLCVGCSSKKEIDASADALLLAAVKNDYAAFQAMSHPLLVPKIPRELFAQLSQALVAMGAYKQRSMTGINVQAGGERRGNYVLSFERGSVDLEVAVTEGKLTAFRFFGSDFEAALRGARRAEYAVWKIGGFQFLDQAKEPLASARYKSGEKILFKMEVHGMTPRGSALELTVKLRVKDAAGTTVYDNPEFLKRSLPLKAGDPPVATVNGELSIPRPGSYTLELGAVDGPSGRQLDHTTKVTVE